MTLSIPVWPLLLPFKAVYWLVLVLAMIPRLAGFAVTHSTVLLPILWSLRGNYCTQTKVVSVKDDLTPKNSEIMKRNFRDALDKVSAITLEHTPGWVWRTFCGMKKTNSTVYGIIVRTDSYSIPVMHFFTPDQKCLVGADKDLICDRLAAYSVVG